MNYEEMKNRMERLYHDRSGRRFTNYYNRQRVRNEPAWKTTLYILLGLILIFGGGIIGMAPVLPAFVFILAGLALIITRLRFAAGLLDKTEGGIRYLFDRVFRKH